MGFIITALSDSFTHVMMYCLQHLHTPTGIVDQSSTAFWTRSCSFSDGEMYSITCLCYCSWTIDLRVVISCLHPAGLTNLNKKLFFVKKSIQNWPITAVCLCGRLTRRADPTNTSSVGTLNMSDRTQQYLVGYRRPIGSGRGETGALRSKMVGLMIV